MLTRAQKRLKNRGNFGLLRKKIIIEEVPITKTLDDYYDISLSNKEIENCTKEYIEECKNLEKEFNQKTGLNSIDMKFLFFATALQCIRQYYLTSFAERVDHKTADRNIKGDIKESSDRKHRWYNPSLQEVILNPVPFDAMFGSPNFNLNIGGGFMHRARTLGHDPLLGWVFGTMNIATSTITTNDFQSFHVKTGFTKTDHARDKITNHADTTKVMKYTIDKLVSGNEGRAIIAASLAKEAIHLKSDIDSIAGLPLPVVSTISPEFSNTLASYGVDASNVLTVGKQAGIAMLINFFIGMLHRLFYDESKDSSIELYEVKTRKILLYSNSIATSSNILYTALSRDFTKLDVGGMMVTIYRLISDTKFINKVKKEFINSKLDQKYDNELDIINERLRELGIEI